MLATSARAFSNTVRYLAAPFPFLLDWLTTRIHFHAVVVIMSAICRLGVAALTWATDIKDQPLPED